MTTAPFTPTTRPSAIPVRDMLPWAILGGLVLLLAIYFVAPKRVRGR